MLQSQGQRFEKLLAVASDKSNFLRKVEFLPKSPFQVKASSILLEVGYFVIIVVSTAIIFGTSQNNVLLFCVFGMFFGLMVTMVTLFHYFSK